MQSSYWPGTAGMTNQPDDWSSMSAFNQPMPQHDYESWRGGSVSAVPQFMQQQTTVPRRSLPQTSSVYHRPQARHRNDREEDVSMDNLPRFLPATDRPPSASTLTSTAASDVSYDPRPMHETYM